MNFIADDVLAINARRQEIRKEEGLPDEDWRTASGNDLEAVAAGLDIYRINFESDYSLRAKIEAAMMRRGKL
jgi:hypothetical protein